MRISDWSSDVCSSDLLTSEIVFLVWNYCCYGPCGEDAKSPSRKYADAPKRAPHHAGRRLVHPGHPCRRADGGYIRDDPCPRDRDPRIDAVERRYATPPRRTAQSGTRAERATSVPVDGGGAQRADPRDP